MQKSQESREEVLVCTLMCVFICLERYQDSELYLLVCSSIGLKNSVVAMPSKKLRIRTMSEKSTTI